MKRSDPNREAVIFLWIAWPVAILLLVALFILPGCASAPAAPTIPTEVRVPVPVACAATKPDKPPRLTDQQIKAMDDFRLVIALALERAVLEVYAAQLEAALAGCWVPVEGGT